MAKATKEPATAGTATAEEEVFEVTVLDEEDEQLLTRSAEPEESVQGAEEGEKEPEKTPVEPEPAKAVPEAKAASEPAKPEPAVAAAPEPEKPVQRPLTPIEREERRKRKDYASKWQSAVEEAERLQAKIAEMGREVQPGKAEIPEERLKVLREAAEKADGLGKVAELSVQEAARLIQDNDRQWAARFTELQRRTHIQISEVAARGRHTDYDQKLQEAGIYAAIKQRDDGSFPNPYLARRILLSADPGEEAYQLAVGRQEYEQAQKGEPAEEAPMAEQPKPAPAAAPKAVEAPKPDVAKPADEAEAERRGGRRVIEKIEANAQKPRGIAGLRSAGAVKTQWSKPELDALMKQSPAKYEALLSKFPDLERFHLS